LFSSRFSLFSFSGFVAAHMLVRVKNSFFNPDITSERKVSCIDTTGNQDKTRQDRGREKESHQEHEGEGFKRKERQELSPSLKTR
jgi:hypothetical protein